MTNSNQERIEPAGWPLGTKILGALVLVGMALAFTERYTPSFFSSSMADSAPELDLVSLFVPSNIFRSLVDNAVPGIVFFCN